MQYQGSYSYGRRLIRRLTEAEAEAWIRKHERMIGDERLGNRPEEPEIPLLSGGFPDRGKEKAKRTRKPATGAGPKRVRKARQPAFATPEIRDGRR